MHNKTARALWFKSVAAALVLIALSGCATAPVEPALSISRERSIVELPAEPGLLEIDNLFGDLHVRTSDDTRLGLQAVIQRIGEHPATLTWVTGASATGFQVSVRSDQARIDSAHRHGRFDLVVFAPRNWALKLSTRDGRVRVRGAMQALSVRTDAGDIAVSAAADVDLKSVSGKINATLSAVKFTRDSQIRSERGDVAVGVPMGASLEVIAEAGRAINAQWNVPAQSSDARSARFVLNGGERQLRIVSRAGTVSLVPVTRLEPQG